MISRIPHFLYLKRPRFRVFANMKTGEVAPLIIHKKPQAKKGATA